MSYQITLSNGSVLVNVDDNVLDHSTSLTLVGKNFLGYGTAIADNFVRLLENAANITAPVAPLTGQLWYDSAHTVMKVWTGSLWLSLAIGVSSVIGNIGAVTLPQLIAGGLAPLASPVLTGTPQAPTANVGTATNQIASTAFVSNQISGLSTGVISVIGSSGIVTLAQLISGGLAPLSNPAFTNTPTVPTAALGTNTIQIASTAFVKAAIANITSGVTSVLNNTGVVTLLQLISGGLAPLVSPAFSGIPQVPTAAKGTSTQQIASTAFVIANNVGLTNTGVVAGTYSNTTNVTVTADGRLSSIASGFTPVQQGGGIGQTTNKVYLGWSSTGLKLTIDGTDEGVFAMLSGNNIFTGTTNSFNTISASTLTATTINSTTISTSTITGSVYCNVDSGGFNVRYLSSTYSSGWRNDSVTTYLLLTKSNDPKGSWTTLRPFYVNNASGAIGIDGTGAGVTLGGALTVGGTIGGGVITGARVRATSGATGSSDTLVVPNLADFVSSKVSAGYQTFPTGVIIQWFPLGLTNQTQTVHTFPLAFPTACTAVICQIGFSIPTTSNQYGVGAQFISNSQMQVVVTTSVVGLPSATGVWCMAIGY